MNCISTLHPSYIPSWIVWDRYVPLGEALRTGTWNLGQYKPSRYENCCCDSSILWLHHCRIVMILRAEDRCPFSLPYP